MLTHDRAGLARHPGRDTPAVDDEDVPHAFLREMERGRCAVDAGSDDHDLSADYCHGRSGPFVGVGREPIGASSPAAFDRCRKLWEGTTPFGRGSTATARLASSDGLRRSGRSLTAVRRSR